MPDDSPTNRTTNAAAPAAGGAGSGELPPDRATNTGGRPAQDPANTGGRVVPDPVSADRPATHDPSEASGRLTGGSERDLTKIGLRETTAAGDKAGFRLAAFGALLIVVLFAGYGLGRLNNSTVSASAPTSTATNGTGTGTGTGTGSGAAMPGMAMDESQPHTHSTDGTVAQSSTTTTAGAAVGGLSLSSGGLTLVPTTSSFTAGKPQRLAFRIAGPGGAPVTTYAVVHDKLLHLIVIRRDLSGFRHLHPTMAADGTWGIDLTLAQPGIYRMIADFTAVVGGTPIATTLGTDLTVAGNYAPVALPAPVKAVAADGFAVGYEGMPSTKSTQPLLLSVAGPDHQAAVLEPYLGAYGHLVVLRAGDLAYVHVHPEAQLVDGKVKFWLAVPSSGTYRMFFDFQVAGQVHTAAWTVEVS
ncbi:hypothetical protein BJ973_006578 [Actinoplanes tereljensis]|uniref:Secreted protein n=1 Tax=Paractinoplanes tereljensis TaxID=571912 RepID=A0A919TQU5_9ACTN|nr:hypothetical protein [Actinoplanes tereljensis]GIF19533.1 hypothetical protein Ate02nite_22630 [Actinoplanes tereljensis]